MIQFVARGLKKPGYLPFTQKSFAAVAILLGQRKIVGFGGVNLFLAVLENDNVLLLSSQRVRDISHWVRHASRR